jgi:hypothetical protein
MDPSLPENQILCTQCGGELHPDEGQIFLTCPFCNSTVYVDKSRVVFHWFVAPTLDESKARGALARWMAGNQTVKDLDQKSRVTEVQFEYFPVWYFKRRLPDQREDIQLVPAAATAVSELRSLRLPGGDLRKYTSDIDNVAHTPSVPLQAALGWLSENTAGRSLPGGSATLPRQPNRLPGQLGNQAAIDVIEQSLVHIPLYTFKYAYNGGTYTAIVEGATGEVFANIYPAKAEAPYLVAGGLTALVFLCLALFPVIGGAYNGGEGAGVGFLVCAGSGIVAAPILFAIAAWVAAKI